MSWVLPLEGLSSGDLPRVGGKAVALSRMSAVVAVPPGVVITTGASRRFLRDTRLAERIQLELSRKRFEDMRWEELWDAALRIRSRFLRAPLPRALRAELTEALAGLQGPQVVRSSAPAEDCPIAGALTVVAPLAAAVVERRGGMLIHGAIVAREYGIPCVTGVPGAAQRIRSGDLLVVDGDLGVVVVRDRA